MVIVTLIVAIISLAYIQLSQYKLAMSYVYHSKNLHAYMDT